MDMMKFSSFRVLAKCWIPGSWISAVLSVYRTCYSCNNTQYVGSWVYAVLAVFIYVFEYILGIWYVSYIKIYLF